MQINRKKLLLYLEYDTSDGRKHRYRQEPNMYIFSICELMPQYHLSEEEEVDY